MDYKYIEQLLERYWQCETSLEEEQILRAFFSQADVPAGLQQYRSLFAFEASEQKAPCGLSADFDERLLAAVAAMTCVKAKRITLASRLRPLMRAAAAVAIVVSLSAVMQLPFSHGGFMGGMVFTAAGDEQGEPEVVLDEVREAFGLTAADMTPVHKADTIIVEMAQAQSPTVSDSLNK